MEHEHPYQERKNSYLKFREIYQETYDEDFPEITFNLDDRGSRMWPDNKEHSMCYPKDDPERKKFAGPDFTFWHWPRCGVKSSQDTFAQITEAGIERPSSDKVAWFGNIESAGKNMPERKTRPMLVEISKAHPDRFDFQHAGPGAAGSNLYVPMPEMVRKYRYLLDIGGAGYSGRLKFLLFSGRLLFLVDRLYVEYFHDDLKPFVHFIPVSSDLSDLLEMHDWVASHTREAETIARNALAYAIENFNVKKAMERLRTVFQNHSLEAEE
jgi:hypothetical protein